MQVHIGKENAHKPDLGYMILCYYHKQYIYNTQVLVNNYKFYFYNAKTILLLVMSLQKLRYIAAPKIAKILFPLFFALKSYSCQYTHW